MNWKNKAIRYTRDMVDQNDWNLREEDPYKASCLQSISNICSKVTLGKQQTSASISCSRSKLELLGYAHYKSEYYFSKKSQRIWPTWKWKENLGVSLHWTSMLTCRSLMNQLAYIPTKSDFPINVQWDLFLKIYDPSH